MTPPSGKPTTHMVSGQRARRGKKYVVLVIAAAALVIGAVLPFAFAQSRTTGAVHPMPLSYIGVHEPDAPGSYTGVDQFAQGIGMQPNLVSYYSPWIEPFQVGFAISAMDRNAVTLVQMDPTDVSLESIAAGEYDSYLRSYGTAVKAFAGQVILSFGHEMNGNWSSWGYQHTSPRAFVAAWQHIVTVFRTVGAMNVTWLWTVNVINNNLSTPIPDPAPWWPGSSYVNWVGIDGYYYNSSSTFSSLFGPTIVDVRRFTGDPILIAETGAEVSAGQPAKINDLFNGVRSYGLLGFVWFDENVEGRTWRIDRPEAFAAFRHDSEAFLRSPAIPKSARQDPSASGSSL